LLLDTKIFFPGLDKYSIDLTAKVTPAAAAAAPDTRHNVTGVCLQAWWWWWWRTN